MVAYSFQPSFHEPIRLKEKRQTIRLPRKRHARPGERLQLMYGPRMNPGRLGFATCAAARECRLDFDNGEVLLDDAVAITAIGELNAFAVRDGFNPMRSVILAARSLQAWDYMGRWWAATHPDQPVFAGVLIDWGETFEPWVVDQVAA